MNLTVIGHLCKDIIHPPEQTPPVNTVPPEERFGGIVYSVAALAGLMSDHDKIYPVFGVGNGDYEGLMEFLKRYPNVDTSGVYKFKGKTNRVRLFYQKDGAARSECSEHISPPIPYSRIKPYLDSDGILINMVSGSDIALETLDQIRMEVRDRRTPIHFDFHSLTLGIDREFKRFRRPLTEWRRWCFMLNSIQMSEEEAAGLTTERYDQNSLINHLMPLMVTALVITRGSRGATLVLQDIHKKLTTHEIQGVSAGSTVDTTGCGDVFGAAFLCSTLKTKDHLRAAQEANVAAAVKATVAGPEQLTGIGHEVQSLSSISH